MAIEEHDRYKLKKFVNEISKHRARHTELISVYVPAGYDLNNIMTHLSEEAGTASNIKSAATRNNVITALEKMMQHLRLFKQTPKNGLVVFSGNVSEREGKEDFQVWSIEPPVPLNQRLYRCDKEFVVEPLVEMMDIKEVFGLVVIDRRDADIAILKGKTIIPLVNTHSEVPGKFKAGGQSAQRFARLIEGAAKDHYKKVAEYMKTEFLPNIGNIKGILVGGPGPTKNTFVEGNFITDQVKQKIIGVKDLGYTGEFGLQELVEKSDDILANEAVIDEKKIMLRFFEKLQKEPDMVTYGEKEVFEKLNMGAVDTLIVSESFDDKKLEEMEEIAKTYSSEIKIISTETREGVQLREIGGVVAILRYPC